MGLGLNTWLFYGLGLGKHVPSVEPWQIFNKKKFSLKLNFSHQSFGGLPGSELVFLLSLVEYLHCKSVFEFGTCTGVTAYNIASNMSGDVYTLDLPLNEKPIYTPDIADEEYRSADLIQYEDPRPLERVHYLKCDSAKFDSSPYKNQMDFVFVDASHSYEYVMNDSAKAFEMLAARGAILWHDYMPAWKGVVKGLNEIAGNKKLFHIKGTSLVLYLSDLLLDELKVNL